MLSCFSKYQHTNNADPWEGGRRLADLSHRGEVSEAAKELHRAECNVLATTFWEWAVMFLTYIYQRDNRVLVGSIEVLMPGYQKKSGSWYLWHIDPNLRNIYLSDPVLINWLGVVRLIYWLEGQSDKFGLRLSSVATYKTSTCVGMDLISDLSSDRSR